MNLRLNEPSSSGQFRSLSLAKNYPLNPMFINPLGELF
ncbi:hypothetical protein AM1_1447 [Acaryochloris marina MBIC11017]|uniref:Uncharacterized protein n=1 Tax=Acaryochloris marina (strain MBIC 11017) TaxID=329726 RepID=B0C7T4_ACAM1|nr:hypothetical protein AM1_1447 [Acaryochloris marina MBIC11017]